MDIKIKKRIVGFLLLIGLILIAVPVFFGRSVSSEEAHLASDMPALPAESEEVTVPIPSSAQVNKTPELAQTNASAAMPSDANKVPETMNAPVAPSTNMPNVPSLNAASSNNAKTTTAAITPTSNMSEKAAPTMSSNALSLSGQTSAKSMPLSPPAQTASVPAMPSVTSASNPAPTSPVAQLSSSVPTSATTATQTDSMMPSIPHKANTSQAAAPKSSSKTATNAHGANTSKTNAMVSPLAQTLSSTQMSHKKAQKMSASPEANDEKTTQTTTANTKASSVPAGAHAWAIQIGSFRERSNAEKIVKKLRSAGISAYVNTVKTAKGDLLKVMAGPYLSRDEAAKTQTSVEQQFNLKGSLIVKANMS